MPAQAKFSTVETALTVLREAAEPLTFDELLAAVNAVTPIPTRDPVKTLRSAINNTRLIQRTRDGRYGYVPGMATGSVLRHVLTGHDLRYQRLVLDQDVETALWPAAFEIEKRTDRGPRTVLLPDGREFAAPLEFFASRHWGLSLPDWVGQWLESQNVAAGDALIVQIVDGEKGIVRLEWEPRAAREEARIMVRNAAVRALTDEICRASQSHGVIIHDLVARLLTRSAYQDPVPPDPLTMILAQDPYFHRDSLLVTRRSRPELPFRPDWGQTPSPPSVTPLSPTEIVQLIVQGRLEEAIQAMQASGLITERDGELTVDLRGLFDGGTPEPGMDLERTERRSRRAERRARRRRGRRRPPTPVVYRFKAAFQHRQVPWRRLEIRSDQTLGELDELMREAFGHDSWDHLSEFWQGEAWGSEGLGEIYPGGEGPGSGVLIGAIGLAEGGRLGYVYDFGDDIRHVLTLEQIAPVEPEATYPRIIEQNKPRYHYCESCRKRGEKTVAVWVCMKCSNDRLSDVYLCEDCLVAEHEDHWAEEVVY